MRSNQLSYPAIVLFSECKGMAIFLNGKKNSGKIYSARDFFLFLPTDKLATGGFVAVVFIVAV